MRHVTNPTTPATSDAVEAVQVAGDQPRPPFAHRHLVEESRPTGDQPRPPPPHSDLVEESPPQKRDGRPVPPGGLAERTGRSAGCRAAYSLAEVGACCAFSEWSSRVRGCLRMTFSHEPLAFSAVASVIWSTASRNATSLPSPQVMRSTSPSRVRNESLPAPPSSVSPTVSVSPFGPGCTSPRASAHRRSLPSPPLVVSVPRLAKIRSLPGPPLWVSSPVPPAILSLPFSPLLVS